ncbi:MAG TPA: hypothetical protein PLZ01_07325 [bacterium]|mgnify:CR=1 FL=1|nr:hypothetical protein [bacterium]
MQARPQTVEESLLAIADNSRVIILSLVGITLGSLLICWLLLKSNRPRWAHQFMSLPILITTVPGIFFCLVLAYLLFITKANLLTVPWFYYFPPLWMGLSLYLFGNLVDFDLVHGFDRISGLALFSAVSFAAIFILARLHIVAIFWLRPAWLIPLVILFYLGWRFALQRMFRKRSSS